MDKEEVIEIFTQYLDDFKVSYRWIPTPADVNYSELFLLPKEWKTARENSSKQRSTSVITAYQLVPTTILWGRNWFH